MKNRKAHNQRWDVAKKLLPQSDQNGLSFVSHFQYIIKVLFLLLARLPPCICYSKLIASSHKA